MEGEIVNMYMLDSLMYCVSESTLLCYDNKCLKDDYLTSLCRRKCQVSLVDLEAGGGQGDGGGGEGGRDDAT